MITWITPAGNLGLISERVIVDIPLVATTTRTSITYTLIAGSLPRGLKLTNGRITGSTAEVRKFTESRFVIRADDGADIKDQTFKISVDGADIPAWVTREGFLNVGAGESYFVLDNARVDFQLTATDKDLTTGDTLEYYLVPMGGELPPGLSLSKDGVISGFTDPIFALEYNSVSSGGYDTAPMDYIPLDLIEARSNGFDDYFYDNVTYDYNEPSRVPKRLSRVYNFVVAVTDGSNSVNRLFKIYVVTEEFLQSDNSIVQVDTNLFQADNTGDRQPLWITESNLGRFRANNYVTIFLDVYDPPALSGTITYFLLPTNPGTYRVNATGAIITNGRYEISGQYPSVPGGSPITNPASWTVLVPETVSVVPPGMELDSITGEIAGRVPYQSAVTKTYTFTMLAVNYPASLSNLSYTLVGDWDSSTNYTTNQAVRYIGFIWVCSQANRNQTPVDGSIYWFRGVETAEKTFTVDIIGEIESAINWLTDSNLGSIKPNQPSTVVVKAESLLYGGRVTYEFVSGTLPPGLVFLPTGVIQGKVKQFADSTSLGLTRFYEDDSSTITYNTTFDLGSTTFDKKFTFVVKARDSANFSEVLRTFFITVIADNTKTFANLYVKAFQTKQKRLQWYNFITDSTIFTPSEIYRYGDANFGIQTDIKMLVYAGIESTQAVNYVQAMSRNHYRKQILFGNVKIAKAKDPVTQETLYELIYVEILDDLEKNGKSISRVVELSNTISSPVLISYDSIKIDSDIPLVSDRDHQRVFPNSIKNMRKQIVGVGESDREFLPQWMRSIQDSASYELGFTKALPLCYVQPGKATNMVARIKASGFDFKSINFTADRYIIDIINGEIEDKYLAFPQRGEKLP